MFHLRLSALRIDSYISYINKKISFMKRLYIDMDDVLCNFSKSFRKHKLVTSEPALQKNFFLNLEPIDNSIFYARKLKDMYDLWLLTKPKYENPFCYTEKRLWVENHLGLSWCEKLILCPDKSLMIGDFLVDDTPWPGFQGEQLLFGSDEFPNWETVYNRLAV